MKRVLTASALALALLAAGCGGSHVRIQLSSGRQQGTQPQQSAPAFALPSGVPSSSDRAADPANVAVIKSWAAADRRGDFNAAAHLFAQPSRFQNDSPVLVLRSYADRRAVNASLPCGAFIAATQGAANDYTIVTYRLTSRAGSSCGTGAGQTAKGVVQVKRGRITGWYRLPDSSTAPSVPGGSEQGAGPTV